MIVGTVTKGRTMKTVTLQQVMRTDDERAIVDAALAAAREDRSSVFGTRVDYSSVPGVVTVTIHTD